MSKKLVISIVLGLTLVCGGALFFLINNDSKSSNSETNQQSGDSSGTRNEISSSENPIFQPLATTAESFVVELQTSSDDTPFAGTISYDGQGNYVFEGSFKDDQLKFYSVDGKFISCQNENCFALPNGDNGVDNSTFEFDEETLSNYQKDAVYTGKADCPAGVCDKWTVANDKVDIEILVAEDGRISKASGITEGSEYTAVFSYEPVTIIVPENVLEFPLQ